MLVRADTKSVPTHTNKPTWRAPLANTITFFWATWCGPCKASVPALLAYAASTKRQVIAISDEEPQVVAEFLKIFPKPFPGTVATDPLRSSYIAYGVSGTPTFAEIDEKGTIVRRQVGYSPGTALFWAPKIFGNGLQK